MTQPKPAVPAASPTPSAPTQPAGVPAPSAGDVTPEPEPEEEYPPSPSPTEIRKRYSDSRNNTKGDPFGPKPTNEKIQPAGQPDPFRRKDTLPTSGAAGALLSLVALGACLF